MTKADIVALVLVAGAGKRFWPFVTDKNMFPFLGKTLIEFSVGSSLPKEISNVVLVANKTNQKQMSALKLPVPHTVIVQQEGDGMAKAILTAKTVLQNKRLLVIIGDDVTDAHVFSSILAKAGHRHFGVLSVWHARSYFPGGYIRYQGERPVEIVEKPTEGKEPSAFVYFGGQYIENADVLIQELEKVKTIRDDAYELALTSLMKSQDFATVPVEDPFVSLKYPWHVLDVMRHLLQTRLPLVRGKKVEIRNNVSIEGPVYIGNNVRIFENTKIVGPVFIGDNTIIGTNNIIRESHIGSDCVTGFNTDITRSYVGDHCWFHSNYIGDSVLEGNVSMGAGTVLANLRLDEGEIRSVVNGESIYTKKTKLGAMIAANVRIGVNASIMPGVKIGSGSMVGAGCVIDKDLPESSFCAATGGYIVKKNTGTVASCDAKKGYKSKL